MAATRARRTDEEGETKRGDSSAGAAEGQGGAYRNLCAILAAHVDRAAEHVVREPDDQVREWVVYHHRRGICAGGGSGGHRTERTGH